LGSAALRPPVLPLPPREEATGGLVGFANHRRGILPKGTQQPAPEETQKDKLPKGRKSTGQEKKTKTPKSPNNTSKTEGLLQQSYCVPQVRLGGFLLSSWLLCFLFSFPPKILSSYFFWFGRRVLLASPLPTFALVGYKKKRPRTLFFDRPTVFVFVQLACSALRANPFPEVTDLSCRLPLPTLFYLTRGFIPWRPDAVMGTDRRAKSKLLFLFFGLLALPRIFKGRRRGTRHLKVE